MQNRYHHPSMHASQKPLESLKVLCLEPKVLPEIILMNAHRNGDAQGEYKGDDVGRQLTQQKDVRKTHFVPSSVLLSVSL
jgi:hypothetical protein